MSIFSRYFFRAILLFHICLEKKTIPPNIGMPSVPDILPSVKFAKFANKSCFSCFSWRKKEEGNLGEIFFDKTRLLKGWRNLGVPAIAAQKTKGTALLCTRAAPSMKLYYLYLFSSFSLFSLFSLFFHASLLISSFWTSCGLRYRPFPPVRAFNFHRA